jgi:two-component system sensor histidine kinase RegB
MQGLSWQSLRRFAVAVSGPSRERPRDRGAASPGDERLARMGAVLAGAAHELCSPLTTIAVLVEELRQRPDADDCRELAESLRIMSEQIDACRSIVARLSEHSGCSAGR